MDDKKSKSSWGELAEELGAKPSSKAFERSQPPAVEIPSSEDPSAQDEPQQEASDWNALANTLGLEVPATEAPKEKTKPEPVESVAEKSEVQPTSVQEPPPATSGFGAGLVDEVNDAETDDAETDDETLPPLPSEVDQIMSEGDWEDTLDSDAESDSADSEEEVEADSDNGMSGETARNAFDALFTAGGSAVAFPPPEAAGERSSFDAEESVDPLASSEESADKPSEAEGEEQERPKRKRSRRRRRGRGGRKSETEQTAGEEAAVGETTDDDSLQSESPGNGAEETSSDEEKKPRRRRSRRRSQRSENSEDPIKRTDVEEPAVSDDEEVSTEQGSSGRDSTGHRNMPTWTEALHVIVEANIENHSKTPSSSGPSRGRGRGRGRSGGGGGGGGGGRRPKKT